MHDPDSTNWHFQIAEQFVNQTARHLFITGKAGTGKTTFLKHIQKNTHKKLATVAPTGVAAINAGGVTIHSFFQLPFGSFLPGSERVPLHSNSGYYNAPNLLKHLRLSKEKLQVIREIDLLIIDEVSMVRADLLDAMDVVLRHVRKKPRHVFGGVQMLFIGDLFQLPPVVKDDDWHALKQYYKSCFFFHARALEQAPPLYLELKKIYRQSDEDFIRLLNNCRNSRVSQQDLHLLRQKYHPSFRPETKGEYIILTTHNSKADAINQKELDHLSGKLHTFKADVEGTFYENAYPAEETLHLKAGAQVMFIKNDKGEHRRYYNGKLGTVTRIEDEDIYVSFPGETEEIRVEKEIWQNLRYKYDKENDEVEEEEIGKFSQFPLRLAWAITIHKSQGLTFEKAIIDAGASFAPGQVYVALSRLTTLEGLVLYSPIDAEVVTTDREAIEFAKTELPHTDMAEALKMAQKQYLHDMLLESFDWGSLAFAIETFAHQLEGRKIPVLDEAKLLAEQLMTKVREQEKFARRFATQLHQLLPKAEGNDYHQVNERVSAAKHYFHNDLQDHLAAPLQEHYRTTEKLPRVRKYLKEIRELLRTIEKKKYQLSQIATTSAALAEGKNTSELLLTLTAEKTGSKIALPELKSKPSKGDSHKLSLRLFREGKGVEDIAMERHLAISTIEGHLASFVASGELQVEELVSSEKLTAISKVIEALGDDCSSAEVKQRLGDEFSYGEIKAVINHNKVQKNTTT